MNKNPAMNYMNYDNHVKKHKNIEYLSYTKNCNELCERIYRINKFSYRNDILNLQNDSS